MDSKIAQVKQWITISAGWDGCPVAMHIQQEGGKSYLGQVQDYKELKIGKDDETPEDKEERLKQYDGMIKKEKAAQLIGALKKVKNKDEYFLFFDQNNLYEYAEQMLEAGFTNGLFPTKEDYEMEKEREAAMDFVQEHYPDVMIIPHEKYKTVEEARQAVEESDVPLVIQSEGDYVSTIVGDDDVEQSKILILSALDKHEKEYSQGEIILKEKLIQPVEITPQMVFWNGEPVFTDLDIESKNIGNGENNGNQVGCGTNLIIRTDMNDEINRIAFPPKVYEMAKKHTGLFYWDISLYFTEKGIYFGEFCSNRPGYDASLTEMCMAGGAMEYFNAIMSLKNPLKTHFGAAVRVFNLSKSKEQEVVIGDPEYAWMFEVTKKDDKIVSTANAWDLGVVTGKGDTIEDAVEEAYEYLKTLTFKEKYTRTKDDFLTDYPTSIVRRFNDTNNIYYDAPSIKTKEENYEHKISKLEEKHKRQVDGFKKELKDILYADQTTV